MSFYAPLCSLHKISVRANVPPSVRGNCLTSSGGVYVVGWQKYFHHEPPTAARLFRMFKNPIVQGVLTVLAVIFVLKMFKPQVAAIPFIGTNLTLS